MQCYHELKSYVNIGNGNKVSTLLNQMVNQGIPSDQLTIIPKIHKIARKAKKLNLLDEEGLAAAQKIAVARKLYCEESFTLTTLEGKVEINRTAIKKNSTVLQKLIKVFDVDSIAVDLSKNTVEFLKKCLQSTKDIPIELPEDSPLIQELLRYLAGYGFDRLLKRLELPITNYLRTHHESVLEEDWLNTICSVRQIHPNTAAPWDKVIMFYFCEKYEIPVFQTFKVPLDTFFDDKTRDIAKYLPLVFLIKNKKDINDLVRACPKNTSKSVIPLTVHSQISIDPKKEEIIKKIAKTFNILLSIKQNILPPGTCFFGKKKWDKHLGKVNDLPLPDDIGALLDSEIIYNNGQHTRKKWKDLFMLFLLPKTVDGKPLTLNLFRALVNKLHPELRGYIYDKIIREYGEKPVECSIWMLLSLKVTPGTRNITHYLQVPIVEELPGCKAPHFLAAYVGYSTHFIDTGKKMWKEDSFAFTVCKETTETATGRRQITVGGYNDNRLHIEVHMMKSNSHGLSALRVFKSKAEEGDNSKNAP